MQPSSTIEQAKQYNWRLKQQVYAEGRKGGYINPRLDDIDQIDPGWPKTSLPPAHRIPCLESLVGLDPSMIGGSVLFRTPDRFTIHPGMTKK